MQTRIAIFAVILLFVAGAAAQSTINVPADQPTIQSAITAANPGDTVLVAPGTYYENINFGGKAITLKSSAGAASTIIDGNAAGTVVTFNHGETSAATLTGFTIRNGNNLYAAGGIEIDNASPVITNNIITANHATGGIGITVNGGSPLIQGNTLTGNTQIGSGSGGGGIYVAGHSDFYGNPQIIGNTITNNSVGNGGFGGGIYVSYFASPLIQSNYIAGNQAYNYGGGIAVDGYGSPVVAQNLVINNHAGGGGSGGGIYVSAGTSPRPVLVSNTLYDNTAFDGSSGMYISAASALLENNVVFATTGAAITCSTYQGPPTAAHNLAYSANGVAWSSACAALVGVNGNLTADPLFVNAAAGDFHLQPGSAAVDAGDNSAQGLPSTDYDGLARIADAANTCTFTVDLGAFELHPTAAAQIVLNPTTLTFQSQVLGTTSAPQAVTISNTGQACVQIKSLAMSPADFAQTSDCGSTIAAGASCTAQISYTPSAAGAISGTLSLTSTAGFNQVALFGTGQQPQPDPMVSPASIDFGWVPLNTSAPSQTITIQNAGTGPLYVTSVSTAAPFSVVTTNCGTVAANASCSIQVGFQPTVAGAQSGQLTIASNAPSAIAPIPLAGNQNPPPPTLAPASLSFADQNVGTTSPVQYVTLQNPNTAPLAIGSITVSGDFTLTSYCSSSLAANSNCTLAVAFKPTAGGARTGALTVQNNSSVPTLTASLSGNGLAGNPVLSTTSLNFGATLVSTSAQQAFTISNTGNGTLWINSSIAPSNAGFVIYGFGGACTGGALTIPANQSCTVNVSFSPATTGAKSATLTLTSNAPTAIPAVALSGTGTQPNPVFTPATLSFSGLVGVSSAAQTATLQNNGDGPFLISSISTGSSAFAQTNNCPATLAPGASCSVSVTYTPDTGGGVAAYLSAAGNVAGTQPNVALSGSASDFRVAVSPTSVTINSGQTANFSAKVSAAYGAYTAPVSLACSGAPAGATCTVSPTAVTPGSSTVSASVKVATPKGVSSKGTYTITISGTVGSVVRSGSATLVIAK